MIDELTVRKLEEVGIEFAVHNGCILLNADEAIIFLRDEDLAIASAFGISKAQYLAYKENENSGYGRYLRCMATTKAGHRCLNNAKPIQCINSPRDFVEKERVGGYCRIHGGTTE